MHTPRSKLFARISAIDLSEATLPHWLRPEWIEPAVVRGERLGVLVVVPRPAMATVQSAPAASDFAIASVAHEVKQPLAAIELYAGTSLRWLARQQPDLAQAREGLERIVQEVKRAGDVVSRVRGLISPGSRTSRTRQPGTSGRWAWRKSCAVAKVCTRSPTDSASADGGVSVNSA